MTKDVLESSAVSAFSGSLATMLAAGIQYDEAMQMLAEERGETLFGDVCEQMRQDVVDGQSLSGALERSGAFPAHAVEMVTAGEQAGHLEQVLRNLETYYDEEDRMFEKLRTSVAYPAAMLTIMTVILAFTVAVILPVFRDVYANMAASVAPAAAAGVAASGAIGWAALAVSALAALVCIAFTFAVRSASGRARVMRLFERVPFLKSAMYQLALSRFLAVLSTQVSAGVTEEEAVRRAAQTVEHATLRSRLVGAREHMVDLDNPRTLSQALVDNGVLDALYARLLNVGMRSGATEATLAQLSSTFFEDAILQIDRALDRIEPVLAAFMTVAVGTTLIAAMLPLLGIMASLG